MNSILVKADWDPEAGVWVATSEDVPGLVAEAASLEILRPKLVLMIEDLIEEKVIHSDLREIPVHLVATSLDRVGNVKAA